MNKKELMRRDIENDILTAIRAGNDRMVEHLEDKLRELDD